MSDNPLRDRSMGLRESWFWCETHGDYAIIPKCPQCAAQPARKFGDPTGTYAESTWVSELDGLIQRCNDERSPYPDDTNWSKGFGCAMTMALGWIVDARYRLTGIRGMLSDPQPALPREEEKP